MSNSTFSTKLGNLHTVSLQCKLWTLTINFVHSLKWLLDYCVWKIEYWFNGPWITANSFKKDSRIIRLIEDELHRYIYLMDYHSWLLLIVFYVWFYRSLYCFWYFLVFQILWQRKLSFFSWKIIFMNLTNVQGV